MPGSSSPTLGAPDHSSSISRSAPEGVFRAIELRRRIAGSMRRRSATHGSGQAGRPLSEDVRRSTSFPATWQRGRGSWRHFLVERYDGDASRSGRRRRRGRPEARCSPWSGVGPMKAGTSLSDPRQAVGVAPPAVGGVRTRAYMTLRRTRQPRGAESLSRRWKRAGQPSRPSRYKLTARSDAARRPGPARSSPRSRKSDWTTEDPRHPVARAITTRPRPQDNRPDPRGSPRHRIDITTIGRTTGKPRRIEIVFHRIDAECGSPGCRHCAADRARQSRRRSRLSSPQGTAGGCDLPATARS